jgi:hypothetical protein
MEQLYRNGKIKKIEKWYSCSKGVPAKGDTLGNKTQKHFDVM